MKLELYQRFVEGKAAPQVYITEQKFHLLHAALGLYSEYVEVVLSDSDENLKEEMGDLLFYSALMANTLGISLDYPGKTRSKSGHIATQLHEVCDAVKKHVMYGQDNLAEIKRLFQLFWVRFCNALWAQEISIPKVMDANVNKLKKRYSKKFTTEESIQRKDKV